MTGCLHCDSSLRLTSGAEIYPHIPRLKDKPIWRCTGCEAAWVGCHPGTTDPLGKAADARTRKARMALHRDMLDPLWMRRSRKFGELSRPLRTNARRRVYAFLAAQMGLPREYVHTGLFTVEQCRQAWRALAGQTPATILQWATDRAEAAPEL